MDAAIIVIMEEEDLKPSDKEAGIGDYVSPRKESAIPCGGDELNAVEDVQDSTKAIGIDPQFFFFSFPSSSLNSKIYLKK